MLLGIFYSISTVVTITVFVAEKLTLEALAVEFETFGAFAVAGEFFFFVHGRLVPVFGGKDVFEGFAVAMF